MTAKLAAAPEPTTYDWPTTRSHAIQAFNGDTPGQTMEAAIVIHFQAEPVRVLQLVDAIGRRVSQGQVRSGWAVLRHELEQRPALVVASDGQERSGAVRLAEAWIRHAGHLVDREEELIDELFGVRGRLRYWPDLQSRMVGLWQTRRANQGDERGDVVVVGVGAGARVVATGAVAVGPVAPVAGPLEGGGGGTAAEGVAGAAAHARGVGFAAEGAPVSDDAELAYFDNIELPEEDE